jgi:hypothetical protein
MRAKVQRLKGKSHAMNLAYRSAALAMILGISACSEPESGTLLAAAQVVRSPNPWPTPRVASPGAPPQILALWMNETSIPSGRDWYGRAITTTNVASLEIRTESFSFVAQRVAFGDFRFRQHVLDMVPYYKRPYTLHVIARNTTGDQDELLVRIAFR